MECISLARTILHLRTVAEAHFLPVKLSAYVGADYYACSPRKTRSERLGRQSYYGTPWSWLSCGTLFRLKLATNRGCLCLPDILRQESIYRPVHSREANGNRSMHDCVLTVNEDMAYVRSVLGKISR